jgi:drug/metabolite transporter (DMT)-like permease
MQEIRPVNWLKISILAIIWGASFMLMSVALRQMGPLMLVAARLSLGAVFLVCLAHLRGGGLPAIRGKNARVIWGFALIMGLFSNAIPFAMLAWGLQYVASGFAGVCMAVVPLLVLPLAHFLVPGERMTMRRSIGFAIGTTGVVVLIGPQAFSSTGSELELWARLACVGASMCYAIGSITTRLCPQVDMLSLSAAALCLASAAIIPYALLMEDLPGSLNWQTILAIIYLGLLPTGVAQLLLVQVVRDAGPVFMGLTNYQVPIWAVIFGVFILSEPVPPSLLLALILILGGVALSQAGALRRLFKGA